MVSDAHGDAGAGRCFDAALAGFLLNHLEPMAVLSEMARVVCAGGAIVTSSVGVGPA